MMKTCRKCGGRISDPNPFTVFCRSCDRKNIKGPKPPVEERPTFMPGFIN